MSSKKNSNESALSDEAALKVIVKAISEKTKNDLMVTEDPFLAYSSKLRLRLLTHQPDKEKVMHQGFQVLLEEISKSPD